MGIFSKIFGADQEDAEAMSADGVPAAGAPTGEAVPAEPAPKRAEPATSVAAAPRAEPRPAPAAARDAPPPSLPYAHTVRGGHSSPLGYAGDPPREDASPSMRRGTRPSIPETVDARLLLAQPHEAPPPPNFAKPAAQVNASKPPKKPVKEASRAPLPPATATKAPVRIAATPMVAVGSTKAVTKAAPVGVVPTLELEPIESAKGAGRKPAVDSDEIDSAFGRIVSVVPTGPGKLAVDRATKEANAKLFRDMATEHARPLREFMLDLSVGSTTKQWLDVATPAARAIQKGARELGEPAVAAALEGLVASLERVAAAGGARITDADRLALLRDYEPLAMALPGAFDVANDRARREPLIVRHLLSQIDGVHKVAVDKLFAAGLSSLDALCRSSTHDLTSLAGLEADTAAAVVQRFRGYWRDRTEQPPAKASVEARHRLRGLVQALARAHEELLEAEESEDKAKKRRARAARRAHALEMNVVLVQLGEVELVTELERSATERRIERVRTFIDQPSAHP